MVYGWPLAKSCESLRSFKTFKNRQKVCAIRSAGPENPTLEPNMKCIESHVAEICPFAYVGGIWNPHFGGKGGHRGSAMAPFKRAMVVSYRLHRDRCAICNHSAAIRDRMFQMLKSTGVGHFGPKFPDVPLGVDP